MPTPTSRCPRCGRENEPRAASCSGCAEPLRPGAGAACPACGAAVQPGFRFCGTCGRPLGAAPTARGAPGPTGSGAHAARSDPPPLPRAAAGAARHLRLVLVRSDGSPGTAFALDRPEVVCGRAEGDLRLDDPTVSPRHARFTQADGALRVHDLGSANGTFVRLRAPRRVSVGDELRIGREALRLEPVPPAPAHGVRPWGSPGPAARYRLTQLLDGGGTGDVFPLRDGENAVGREAGDVTFPADRYVSARHARLDVRGDEITLVDAGSSNGTFLRIAAPAELAPGDELLVGGQLLRVEGS